MTSLDMDEIEGCGRLGLSKNLGLPPHDFVTFQRCQGKCVYFGDVFSHLRDLSLAAGVTGVQLGLP